MAISLELLIENVSVHELVAVGIPARPCIPKPEAKSLELEAPQERGLFHAAWQWRAKKGLLNKARPAAPQWIWAVSGGKMYANRAICAQKPPRVFHMYRREHRDQLSFKDFFLPFGGQLSGDNRWIKLAELIPWDELEDDYASQFCKGFGAPAKPFRMALGALIIKARLGLTDEELVEQIKENPYLRVPRGIDSS